jgi:hypothetical protein
MAFSLLLCEACIVYKYQQWIFLVSSFNISSSNLCLQKHWELEVGGDILGGDPGAAQLEDTS